MESGEVMSQGFGFSPGSAPGYSEVWGKLFPPLDISFFLCDIRRLDR